MPSSSYPAGTVIPGPPSANTEIAPVPGVTRASNSFATIIFSNPSRERFFINSAALISFSPIPFVFSDEIKVA
ncbi:LOW QUALITY PROTEIN: hypothetical protein TorRG33x02_208460 [Trema orientale]|uniref:Uncharacterized protein n=1 Tax=Trema orientale TaxID=63057 RepID=A0A2P5ED02_TREOI|nr:LOW QUALITY PROTEIN: hypothetical protein TorRG33x02_208460 [Trema orientale]